MTKAGGRSGWMDWVGEAGLKRFWLGADVAHHFVGVQGISTKLMIVY